MRPLERFFNAYGAFLARHPWPFIVVPALLTAVSSYGFQFFHSQDDIWDIYAPTNGLSRIEEKALQKFEYASGSHHYRMQILITSKRSESLLSLTTLQEIEDAHKLVAENMTISNGERSFKYSQVCGVYCGKGNGAVLGFLKAALEADTSQISLTFPIATAFSTEAFLGYSIGNLTKDEFGVVREIRLVLLHYMVDLNLPHGKALAASFEVQLRTLFEALTLKSEHLKYEFLSRNRELDEQRAISLTAIPYLLVTSLVLLGFMLMTLVNFPLYKSQHFEAVVGIVSPCMALWTTVGFLWWAGFPFSNILTVVPFLVVTIGIDDAFLVLAGWRQSTPGASVEQRMGESIAISGASVAVTSVTDVVCFAIGLFSNMPVVQLFCLYVTIALAVDFVYQLTFFAAVMSVIVRAQVNAEAASGGSPSGQSSETSSIQRWHQKIRETSISTVSSEVNVKLKLPDDEKNWLSQFVDVLHTSLAKVLVMTLFFTHIGISAFLTTKVNTNFDMENLYLASSPLTEISRRMQNFVLKESFVDNFAVSPMPDFANESTRARFDELVQRLETLPRFGGGSNYTLIWTRKYKEAVSFWGDDDDAWSAENLLTNYRDNDLDENFLSITKNDDETESVDGFFFAVVYRNLSSFLEVEEMMKMRRAVIAQFPEFTVFAHHPFEKVPTESAAAAPSNFLQNCASAIVLMSLLVLLFVMKIEAILSVVVSIVSICVGIVGYLHLWGVHLDAVSLISILMSIGFSVDYSAHVCYHYFAHAAEEEKEQKERSASVKRRKFDTKLKINATLRGVGWPVIQSGLSTAMGMLPLMFVHAYVVAVFWKTIILVSLLGMFHALLLLPVIFILTADIKRLLSCKPKRIQPTVS